MKFKILVLALTLAFFLPGFAQAKTLKFPKDDPQFTVTFANDWKAEITSAGIISAQPKGAGYAISIFPVVATNARDAIEETEKEVEKRFQNVKSSEPVEFKTANNIQYLERDYTGTDKGADRTLAIVAFSPDGKNYYALFQAGTPEADKQYTQDVVAIVKSIKSLKASSDDDE
ncbi:MAG TPA: hypothetical protein VEX43_16955 [Chthoniobacterales bacterium]|nr:hypothetical protein [Chthoniobacterales bacterium]